MTATAQSAILERMIKRGRTDDRRVTFSRTEKEGDQTV